MMNDKERNLLAADIARRVRTYAWQPMPADFAALMREASPYSWNQRVPLNFGGFLAPALDLSYYPTPQRLEMRFQFSNGDRTPAVLWTPETVDGNA